MLQMNQQCRLLNIRNKKREVIVSKTFEVTLFVCNLSKSILASPINMQDYQEELFYLNIQLKNDHKSW